MGLCGWKKVYGEKGPYSEKNCKDKMKKGTKVCGGGKA